jgi:hypothetical protein
MPHPSRFTLRNIWTNVIDLQLEEQIQEWKLLFHISPHKVAQEEEQVQTAGYTYYHKVK